MASLCRIVALALLIGAHGLKSYGEESFAANPIRRVVSLLQQMQAKVTEEGKRDQEIYDKFMCYCSTGTSDLEAAISAAEGKIPQVDSALKQAIAAKEQLGKELAQHQADRSEAKAAVAKAKALRKKEAAAYAKESSDFSANIQALGKAIAAIEKGASGFLQTSAAAALRRLTVEMDLSSTDRDMLSAYLTQGQGEGYAPQSGSIVGILKQMEDTMKADLKDTTAQEESAKASFEALVAAKQKEIKANSEAIEAKLERDGQLGVQIADMKEDLDDTTVAYEQDKKFLADLGSDCKTREAEYEVVKKTRAEELVALADTIKILNDDDALDLFKKTLPTPSLLQTRGTARLVKERAARILKSPKDSRMGFIMLALKGQKVSFDKVIGMIDNMVKVLNKEQADDDDKKSYCESQLDKAEDEHKALEQKVSDLEHATEEAKGSLETTKTEIAGLINAVKDLDKSVSEATASRKEENAAYKETMANDNAAKQLLGVAKNRLNKFYNAKLYVEPEAREVSLAQISSAASAADAPPPPPEAVGAYQKKGQESNGVITMIDMLIKDLDKEIQELTVEEKDAQKEYEDLMKDSAAKRADDSRTLAQREEAKADLEAELQKLSEERKAKLHEAMAAAESIGQLHASCDWLLANFDTRKEARTGEIESLKGAKAVLSGADFSLLQTA